MVKKSNIQSHTLLNHAHPKCIISDQKIKNKKKNHETLGNSQPKFHISSTFSAQYLKITICKITICTSKILFTGPTTNCNYQYNFLQNLLNFMKNSQF